MSGIRVLMVLDSMAFGGTETHVLGLAESLERQGNGIVVAGGGGPLANAFRQRFPTRNMQWPAPGAADEEQAIRQIADLLRAEQIAVVHAHQTPSGRVAARAALRLGIPVVFTVHGTYYPRGELQEGPARAAAVISVSKPVQAHLRQLGIASRLIPNGVDTHGFSPPAPAAAGELRRQLGIADDAVTVLYASRLAWNKANVCSTLLLAAKDLRLAGFSGLEIVVAGDGHRYAELERLADRLHDAVGSRFVRMVGNRNDMPDYYRMSDCVVGTGRVALEAMACGKPVLAAGNDGFFGWVEPANYTEAWELYFGDHGSMRAVSRLVMREALRKGLADRSALRHMGEQGRAWVVESFNAEETARQTADVYADVLSPLST